MTLDAAFWVAISFFIFLGILIYFKVPQKVNNVLNENISNIKNQINEAEKLKEEAKNILSEHEKKISNSKAEDNNIKHYYEDLGTLALMYHRFNENKYPSTNIQIDIFKKQIEIINNKNYEFENPKNFDLKFKEPKSKKKILITIDDSFTSFYDNAWPFLKKNHTTIVGKCNAACRPR